MNWAMYHSVRLELNCFSNSVHLDMNAVVQLSLLIFPKWTEVLPEEHMTAALLDRLTHKTHILNINGESCRFKQALSKQLQDD